MSITDELRRVAAKTECANGRCEKLYRGDLDQIADRIEEELVELPKGMDGVPIHVGDTVYLDDGHMAKVVRIELMQNESCIDCWVGGGKSVGYLPSGISHKPADSWERIADELVEWCNSVDVDGDACDKPRDIVERIRRLAAKEQDHE